MNVLPLGDLMDTHAIERDCEQLILRAAHLADQGQWEELGFDGPGIQVPSQMMRLAAKRLYGVDKSAR